MKRLDALMQSQDMPASSRPYLSYSSGDYMRVALRTLIIDSQNLTPSQRLNAKLANLNRLSQIEQRHINAGRKFTMMFVRADK